MGEPIFKWLYQSQFYELRKFLPTHSPESYFKRKSFFFWPKNIPTGKNEPPKVAINGTLPPPNCFTIGVRDVKFGLRGYFLKMNLSFNGLFLNMIIKGSFI